MVVNKHKYLNITESNQFIKKRYSVFLSYIKIEILSNAKT